MSGLDEDDVDVMGGAPARPGGFDVPSGDDDQGPWQVPPGDPEGELPEAPEVPGAEGGLFPGLPGYPGEDALPQDLPFEPVDPSTVELDPASGSVHGEPDAELDYWLYQGEGNGTCAPTSVAMVLADVLGVPVGSNDEVVERALQMGLIEYDPEKYPDGGWSGMDDFQIMALAESYGLDVNLRFGDVDDLVAYLDAGHSIMVGVDADEVWTRQDDDDVDGSAGTNHEVVLTGIDLEAGLVYLNDPGSPDGAGEVITLAQFEDAWGDGFNSMIVTDRPSADVAAGLDLRPVDEGGGELPGFEGVPLADLGVTPADQLPDYPRDPGAEEADVDVAAPAEPTGDPAAPEAPVVLDVERVRVEPVDTVPEGVVRVLMLAFTFVARYADELV